MKKSKLLIATLVVMLLSVFCLNARVLATDSIEIQPRTIVEDETPESTPAENAEGENQAGEPVVTSDELDATSVDEHNHSEDIDIYEGDLYVLFGEDGNYSGTDYTMDKLVNGNVYIFGQDVKITGKINGALFVFASTVTIEEEAQIGTHTFIFAETIRMNGVTMDMYAASKNFELTKTGLIYRDLKVGAGNAVIFGQVGRDIDLSAENIQVYKDEETKAYVGRNLNYHSDKENQDMDKITVEGEVKFTETKKEAVKTNTISDYVFDGIVEAIFVLVIYAIAIFLAPKFVEKSKEYASTRGLLAVAVGLGFTVLVPVLAFLLIFTVIGIPVSLIMFVIYILAIVLNSAVVSIVANEFIITKIPAINTTWKKILMIIPVAFVLYLIRQLPVVGGWISAIVLFAGLGIITLYQFDKRKKETIAE